MSFFRIIHSMNSTSLFFVKNSSTWLGLPSPWPQYRSNSEAHKECYKGPFAGETNSSLFSTTSSPLKCKGLWGGEGMKEYLQHFILKIFKLKIVKVLLLYDLVNKTICVSAFKPLKSKIFPARSVPYLSTVLSNPVFKSMLWG